MVHDVGIGDRQMTRVYPAPNHGRAAPQKQEFGEWDEQRRSWRSCVIRGQDDGCPERVNFAQVAVEHRRECNR